MAFFSRLLCYVFTVVVTTISSWATEAQPDAKDAGESTSISAADHVRRLGSQTAPWQVEFILDINCSHCGDVFSSTLGALQSSVDAEKAEVVVRWMPKPRDAEATGLVEHLLASGDRAHFRLLGSLVVGTPTGRGWQFLSPRLSELVDPEDIEQRRAVNVADIQRVMTADTIRIKQLTIGAVPSLIVIQRGGAERGRWEGERFDVDAAVRLLGETATK